MASGSSFSRYSTIVPEAIEGGEDAGNGGGEIEFEAAPSSTSGGSDPFADAAAIAKQRDAEDAEFFNSIKNMDDLVSKTNLQWALRESGEVASAVAGDAAGSASGGAQKRPKARPRPAPSKESEPGRTSGDGAEMLKGLKNPPVSNPEASPAPDPAKAPLALAQAHLIAMRAKLKVVEALLEDEAESVPQLQSIVGGDMSGEDFLQVCEERALAGRCGWPLCATSLRAQKSNPTSSGSKAKPEGKYRIDTKNRKVYLKASLDMFCCTAHRVEAEDFGTSLALDLTGEGGEEAKEALANESGLKGGFLNADKGKEKATTKTERDRKIVGRDPVSLPTKNVDKSFGNVNQNIKMDVLEKRPPRATEAQAPKPPTVPEGVDAAEAAKMIEGFVPKKGLEPPKKKGPSKFMQMRAKEKEKQSGEASESVSRSESPQPKGVLKSGMTPGFLKEKKEPAAKGVRFDKKLETGPTGSEYEQTEEEIADLAKRQNNFESASQAQLDAGPSGNGGRAQFYFNVYEEGGVHERTGKNVPMTGMGQFSEGQITRVIPAGADGYVDADEESDEKDENGGDLANDARVNGAMEEAMRAAEAAARAVDAAGDDQGKKEAAELALGEAREALRLALTKAGGEESGDEGATTDGESTDGEGSERNARGGGPPVSEFGSTWMMMDGWVTRATFHFLGATLKDDEDESPELPPRIGYAVHQANAAAHEISRALPTVIRTLGLRQSPASLEQPLGRMLRTFFFDRATPSLRPERWALVAAVMLEAIATRKIRAGERDDRPPTFVDDMNKAIGQNGGMAQIVENARSTEDERRVMLELLRGECAGGL
mmetsp:Transcript_715/g.2724  ORF Transcript_715/g.2724 Transcript_715/m.2724 type:complete len:827 (+) Transcript_715:23-2503(+)